MNEINNTDVKTLTDLLHSDKKSKFFGSNNIETYETQLSSHMAMYQVKEQVDENTVHQGVYLVWKDPLANTDEIFYDRVAEYTKKGDEQGLKIKEPVQDKQNKQTIIEYCFEDDYDPKYPLSNPDVWTAYKKSWQALGEYDGRGVPRKQELSGLVKLLKEGESEEVEHIPEVRDPVFAFKVSPIKNRTTYSYQDLVRGDTPLAFYTIKDGRFVPWGPSRGASSMRHPCLKRDYFVWHKELLESKFETNKKLQLPNYYTTAYPKVYTFDVDQSLVDSRPLSEDLQERHRVDHEYTHSAIERKDIKWLKKKGGPEIEVLDSANADYLNQILRDYEFPRNPEYPILPSIPELIWKWIKSQTSRLISKNN